MDDLASKVYVQYAVQQAKLNGGGTAAVTAAEVSISDSDDHFASGNVEGALTELFTSVSNGKAEIAAAITDKGVPAAADDTFSAMADKIEAIQTGGVYQSKTVTPDAAGQTVTPDGGYSALSAVIVSGDADLTAGNIKSGVNIFGVTGTYTGSGFGDFIALIDYQTLSAYLADTYFFGTVVKS